MFTVSVGERTCYDTKQTGEGNLDIELGGGYLPRVEKIYLQVQRTKIISMCLSNRVFEEFVNAASRSGPAHSHMYS
jgi:hypothetical protein